MGVHSDSRGPLDVILTHAIDQGTIPQFLLKPGIVLINELTTSISWPLDCLPVVQQSNLDLHN